MHSGYLTSYLDLCILLGHYVVPKQEALRRARSRKLDLVEVCFWSQDIFTLIGLCVLLIQ